MVISEAYGYIGKEYDIGLMMPELRKRYTLIGLYPKKNTVLLDAGDGEDMFEVPIDKFPFEDYIREGN